MRNRMQNPIIKTIEYAHESTGLRPKKDCAGSPSTNENYRPNLLSERAPHINEPIKLHGLSPRANYTD
jgi:hypothetical protein